jgi:uncharacterized protein (TIGR03435 family)
MRLLAVLAIAVLPSCAQSPLSFDVASAKKIDTHAVKVRLTLFPARSGGTIHWVMSLPMLVLYAYRAQMWNTVGLEIDDGFYQVDATTAPAASEEQIREMHRTLLVERFKLSVHRETRELNGYAHSVAKGGPKIRPVPDGEQPPIPGYLRGQEGFADYYKGKVIHTSEGPGVRAMTAWGVSLSQIAEGLEDRLRAFVTDKTGLTGTYYIGLTYSPEAGDSEIPALATALQEQLGLKLEKQKGPVEMLVIDRLQKVPVEN